MSSTEASRRSYVVALPLVLLLVTLMLFTFLSALLTLPATPRPFVQGYNAYRPSPRPSPPAPSSSAPPPPDVSAPNPDKPFYLQDLVDFTIPNIDLGALGNHPPHNYRGPGNPAFATFFITRNGSLHDPLFIAAQQLVYRILWHPERKSDKYPVVVFVLPFVLELQRQYFRAAGAFVVEVQVREFTAKVATLPHYRDQFAKLDMWSQTLFSSLLYLDADALPWNNLDPIFDFPQQRCNESLLQPEDALALNEICDYRFAAWVNDDDEEINAGVMLLQPNLAMYERLVREFQKVDGNIGGTNEQGFLNTSFADPGPFPHRRLSNLWNGGHEKDSTFYILHGKAWVLNTGEISWVGEEFNKTWSDLVTLYESPDFARMRSEDQFSG